jgi:hypothetical protein
VKGTNGPIKDFWTSRKWRLKGWKLTLQNAGRKMRPMKSPGAKRFYEAEGYRPDGTCFTVELLEASSDDEVKALAAHYAQKWRASLKLYRVPAANRSSVSSHNLWPDDMVFIADILPTSK